MLRQVSPDLPDVVEGESTRPGDCSKVGCEGELVIHGHPEVSGRGRRRHRRDPRVIERSWEMEGLAGMIRSSVLARFSWRWCLVIQAEMSVRQASILAEISGSVGGNDRYSCVSSA